MSSGNVSWQQPQPSGLHSSLPVLSVPDVDGDKVGDVVLVASDNTQVSTAAIIHSFLTVWNESRCLWGVFLSSSLESNKDPPHFNVSCHVCRLSWFSSQGRQEFRLAPRWFSTPRRRPVIFSITLQKVLTMSF